jgi:hypothetical protein
MDQDLLNFLQILMLLVDGAGIYASWDRVKYFRLGRHDRAVRQIYRHYMVLFWVFVALSFSDVCVIANLPIWWAKLPIIRGHLFRDPVVFDMLWMIHCQHNGRS